MEYVKNTWVTGDVITAEKMNNIEEGINNLSLSINDLRTEIGLELDEVASLLGGVE